jgi:hypothetical protein
MPHGAKHHEHDLPTLAGQGERIPDSQKPPMLYDTGLTFRYLPTTFRCEQEQIVGVGHGVFAYGSQGTDRRDWADSNIPLASLKAPGRKDVRPRLRGILSLPFLGSAA